MKPNINLQTTYKTIFNFSEDSNADLFVHL